MSVDNHVFIVPIQTLSVRDFKEFLRDRYEFLDTSFVLRNALQLWIDYILDPDGGWYTNVEDEVHRDYGSKLSDMAGRIIFQEGKNLKESKKQIEYKFKLVDDMVSEIVKHITAVSDYITDRFGEDDLKDFVLGSELEILVKSAWVSSRSRSMKFVIEEL